LHRCKWVLFMEHMDGPFAVPEPSARSRERRSLQLHLVNRGDEEVKLVVLDFPAVLFRAGI